MLTIKERPFIIWFMRTIDEHKRQQIIQAVLQISNKDGIANLSIGKIANQVGVSKATIYVYFDNKTDMLGKIYLQIKQLLDTGLADVITPTDSYRMRTQKMLLFFANQFMDHPLETAFMRAVQANPTLAAPEMIAAAEQLAQPLTQLVAEGIAKHYLVTDNELILLTITIAPVYELIDRYALAKKPVPRAEMQELVQIIVNYVLVD